MVRDKFIQNDISRKMQNYAETHFRVINICQWERD